MGKITIEANNTEGHGLECSCNECKKIRNYLKRMEKKGVINFVGALEDLEKIRK